MVGISPSGHGPRVDKIHSGSAWGFYGVPERQVAWPAFLRSALYIGGGFNGAETCGGDRIVCDLPRNVCDVSS